MLGVPKACVERLAQGDGDLLSSPEATRSAAQLYQDEFSRLNKRYPCTPPSGRQVDGASEEGWSLPTTIDVNGLLEGEKDWTRAIASDAAEEASPNDAVARTGPRVVLEDALQLIEKGRCLTKDKIMSVHETFTRWLGHFCGHVRNRVQFHTCEGS